MNWYTICCDEHSRRGRRLDGKLTGVAGSGSFVAEFTIADLQKGSMLTYYPPAPALPKPTP